MFHPIFCAGLAACLTAAASFAMAEITVADAFARSSNPRAGAAFMTIRNPDGPDDRLIDVLSDAAVRVELHTHVMDGDIMRMVEVEEGFALPTGGAIEMERGGAHVMFMGLTAPFDEGETVPLKLVFESGAEVVLDVPVDNAR